MTELTDTDKARIVLESAKGHIVSNEDFERVAMSLKSCGISDGEIDEFMRQSPGYDSTVRTRIKSFHADGKRGIGTLVQWAKDAFNFAPTWHGEKVNLATYPFEQAKNAASFVENVKQAMAQRYKPRKVPQAYALLNGIDQMKIWARAVRTDEELTQIAAAFSGTGRKTNLVSLFDLTEARDFAEIESAIGANFANDTGAWVMINPVHDENGKNESVAKFKYLLWEADEGTPEEQWGAIVDSRLPIDAVVQSGNKSLHAWIRVDAEDAEQYDETAKRVYAALKSHGARLDESCKNANRLCRLPGVQRGDKMQTLVAVRADFPNAFRKISAWLKNEEHPKKVLKKAMSLDDLGHVETPECLIGDIIAPHSFNLVAGDSKVGKSWLMMNLAICAATGTPWLGHEIKKPLRVEYINTEIDEIYFKVRLSLAIKAQGLEDKIDQIQENLQCFTTRGVFEPLSSWADEIIDEIKDFDAHLVILDPLYMVMDGDENSVQDTKPFMQICLRVGAETSAALMATHHHRKGDMTALDIYNRIAGSGIFTRAPDCIIDLSVLKKDILIDRGINPVVDGKEKTSGIKVEYMCRNTETPADEFFWRCGAGWRKDITYFLENVWRDPKKYHPERETLTALKSLLGNNATIIECLDNASRAANAAAQSVKDRILDRLKLKGEPQSVQQLAQLTDATPRVVQMRIKELLNEGKIICANPNWSDYNSSSFEGTPRYNIA